MLTASHQEFVDYHCWPDLSVLVLDSGDIVDQLDVVCGLEYQIGGELEDEVVQSQLVLEIGQKINKFQDVAYSG